MQLYIDGLVQDCSISSALAMEILQPCAKPSISSRPLYIYKYTYVHDNKYVLYRCIWGQIRGMTSKQHQPMCSTQRNIQPRTRLHHYVPHIAKTVASISNKYRPDIFIPALIYVSHVIAICNVTCRLDRYNLSFYSRSWEYVICPSVQSSLNLFPNVPLHG